MYLGSCNYYSHISYSIKTLWQEIEWSVSKCICVAHSFFQHGKKRASNFSISHCNNLIDLVIKKRTACYNHEIIRYIKAYIQESKLTFKTINNIQLLNMNLGQQEYDITQTCFTFRLKLHFSQSCTLYC